MVIVGLIVVVVVSVFVARAGLAYLDGPAVRRADSAPASSVLPHAHEADEGSPSAPRSWMLRGFDTAEAQTWIAHGFDPDHAFLFRTLAVDARTAARLRAAGLEDAALVSLVEEASFAQHDGREQLIELAENAPHLAPHALAWMRLGASSTQALTYATAGFTPSVSDPWRSAGWDMDDALPWFETRFEPEAALAWHSAGFDPHEAGEWKREHFGVRQAMEWRRLGDTPARAREVEQRFSSARVTVAEGLKWLDLGFTVDEVCAGWPAVAAGQDARSVRAAWRRTALDPVEVSKWHAHFDRDATARWLDAGVRDPSDAARLQARGVAPEDVALVARERLADVFNSVPITRDDLLSAAGHLARAGGSPEIRQRLQVAAAVNGRGDPKEIGIDLIEDVLDEVRRLMDLGQLGAPHATTALVRRLERGLIVSALLSGRSNRAETSRAS